jgi:hypothetical protein
MYDLYLIGLAFGFNGIFISPRYLSIPFIPENVAGNKSLYSRNNYVIISIV